MRNYTDWHTCKIHFLKIPDWGILSLAVLTKMKIEERKPFECLSKMNEMLRY